MLFEFNDDDNTTAKENWHDGTQFLEIEIDGDEERALRMRPLQAAVPQRHRMVRRVSEALLAR